MNHKTKRYRGSKAIKRNKLKKTKTKKRLMKGGWGGFVMPQSKEQKQNKMYGGWGCALNV